MNIPTKSLQVVQDIQQSAVSTLIAGRALINRSYLSELERYPVTVPDKNLLINRASDIRVFRIERIVQDNKQSVLESTTAAYTALGAAGYSVFLFLRSDGCETDLYIGTRGESGKMLGHNSGELLRETFKGHFAGSALHSLTAPNVNILLDGLEAEKINPSASITAVTGVPALSTENREHFMQGLERFIDAAERRIYQALILAEPVSSQNLDLIRTGYEQVSTQLSPLLKQQLSFGEQESDSVGFSLSQGLSESLGQSLGLTETKGTSQSTGNSTTETTGTSESLSAQTATSKAATIAAGSLGIIAGSCFGPFGAMIGSQLGTALATTLSEQRTTGTNNSTAHGTSETIGTSHSEAVSKTSSTTQTTSTTDSRSLNTTTSTNRQLSIESVDKSIEQLLGKVDYHLHRIDEAKTYGGWNSAAYFIGDSTASSESLASIFLGLVRGSKSSHEDFALTTWTSRDKSAVLDWLMSLSHPQLKPRFAKQLPVPYVTPATLISSKEMAIQMSLPRRSTSTVSVVDTQAFGRKVQLLDGQILPESEARKLNLGKIRHLWEDLPQPIELDLDQLSSHMFVTGSTGSGKSNTVYSILDQLDSHAVSYLVIETAKGEYKHVFGHRDNVRVLGSNPKHTELLRINPFSFPADTHVLEHADRLIEIFNVCWPMYAAMPAILREAILQSYERCGWDLESSINTHTDDCFPTVIDLLQELDIVINSSAYSQELKSNYSGALLTRVKSLTNGINGQIFTAHEHSCTDLFDKNVLVDLSRIGSMETKSLITGLLIIKLSEYRAQQGGSNRPLHHVTVLEEAHNILARSSLSGADGSSIAEKSVEMLANAIAEMRTYGEGFIIADQSPSALHPAAIRNTNTKVIMRLPDEQDRLQVGKSAGLNDEQINELAKLPRGVAVVYQNNWQEAVQCKVEHFTYEPCNYTPSSVDLELLDSRHAGVMLLRWLLASRLRDTKVLDDDFLSRCIDRVRMTAPTRIALRACLAEKHPQLHKPAKFNHLARIVVELLNAESDLDRILAKSLTDFSEFNAKMGALIRLRLGENDDELHHAILHCFVKNLSEKGDSYMMFYKGWSSHRRRLP